MKNFLIFLLIFNFLWFCSKTKSSTTTSNSSQTFNCSVQIPSFSSLAQAGTTNNCSSCHSGSSAQANFDVTSYSSVIARVQVGNPEGSLLYQKITTGSMKGNSTPSINQAVYCWIKGGAIE